MIYTYGPDGPRRAVETIQIPIESARDYFQLLKTAGDWNDLVATGRYSEAIVTNAERVIAQLCSPGRYSLFEKLRKSADEPGRSYEINLESVTDRYEATSLLRAVVPDGSVEQLKGLRSHLHVETNFGSITFFTQKTQMGGSYQGFATQISDERAFNEFFQTLMARDQALLAGICFADRCRAELSQVSAAKGEIDPISLGSYVFRGADPLRAADAFLARNVSDVAQTVDLSLTDTLRSVAVRRGGYRVTEIIPEEVYEVRGDFLWYRLERSQDGEIEISGQLIPSQLRRPETGWYASSLAAQELQSILLASGVATALPDLLERSSEIVGDDRFGNGYASASRLVCSMISGTRSTEFDSLQQLNSFHNDELTTVLGQFRKMCQWESSRLVIDLLIGALDKTKLPADLPRFKAPSESVRANSCIDAEAYFVHALKSQQYSADKYFIHKVAGEKSSLTRVPIIVNDVVIPKGTLCIVGQEDGRIDWVKPVRLTVFSLSLNQEGLDVFRTHMAPERVGTDEADVRAVYDALDGNFSAAAPQVGRSESWAAKFTAVGKNVSKLLRVFGRPAS